MIDQPHLVARQGNEDPERPTSPPSVGSYIFPLLLVILACAGYLYLRRRQRPVAGLNLRIPGTAPSAVRLSMDDNGPASHSFISNNASTDSLPTHALQDLPVLARSPPPALSAPLRDPTQPSASSQQAASYDPSSSFPNTRFDTAGTRRSHIHRDPVERDDRSDDSDGSEGDTAAGDIFGIGNEDGEEDGAGKTQRDKG